ncbi:MAG: DUF1573 domain-containing protein [bacterium]|nr:DUF1573 domain-containing protein [bacterium]
MSLKLVFLLVLSLTALVIGIVWFASISTGKSTILEPSSNVKAVIPEFSFDWGTIPYSGGNAVKTFIIKNEGTEILKLQNIKTSCTCTRAQISTEQGKSPYFTMHSISSWLGEVAPGKEAQLAVIFDPAFHGPSGTGPITRLISVETNDKNKPKLEFSLKGVVVK